MDHLMDACLDLETSRTSSFQQGSTETKLDLEEVYAENSRKL